MIGIRTLLMPAYRDPDLSPCHGPDKKSSAVAYMDPDPRSNHDGDPDLSPCHDLDRNLAMHDALTVMEIRVRETAMIRIQPFQLSLTGIRI